MTLTGRNTPPSYPRLKAKKPALSVSIESPNAQGLDALPISQARGATRAVVRPGLYRRRRT